MQALTLSIAVLTLISGTGANVPRALRPGLKIFVIDWTGAERAGKVQSVLRGCIKTPIGTVRR